MEQTDFAVYKNTGAKQVMAYSCSCGLLVVGFGDDMKGLFVGTCGAGHTTTVTAS